MTTTAPAPLAVPGAGMDVGSLLVVTTPAPDATTHISIVGDGVLCDWLTSEPWTREVGTWAPWTGERPSCSRCNWLLADRTNRDPEPAR